MKLLTALYFLLGFFYSSLFSEENTIFLEKENERLEYLFNYLFKFNNFSYTLFSDKPISFEDVYTPNIANTSIKNYCILLSYVTPINILESGWDLWKSKFSDVQFNNYIFFDKKNGEYTTIILINKKAFSKTFEINKKIFQHFLGNDLTEEKLLNNIISDKFSLKEALGNHEGLLGILLGYGTNNSMLFQKKQKILKKSRNMMINSKFIQARLSEINKRLCAINNFFGWINVIQPVRFMAITDHSESKKLIKKYSKVNSELSQLYRDGNVVDIVISKLGIPKQIVISN